MFVQPFLTLAAGQCAEASAMFWALCAECKAQKFGGIGTDTVNKLLCVVPDKHPARSLVVRFFDVLLDYKEIVMAGKRAVNQSGANDLEKDVDELFRKLSNSQLRPAASGQTTAASGQEEIASAGSAQTLPDDTPETGGWKIYRVYSL